MNIILVSECEKHALKETRRIIDQFAERRGERTWQTPITAQGLDTLRHLLKKTARKNTAVACHWVRGKHHTELLWIVGDRSRFNESGAVPTNTTTRDVLRSRDESDWYTAEDSKLLAAIAALLHDMGKANAFFQEKLTKNKPEADPFRHEWVSLRLLEALAAGHSDKDWLGHLANLTQKQVDDMLTRLIKDDNKSRHGSPFKSLPPIARAIGWLIVSHHRLPCEYDCTSLHPQKLESLPEEIKKGWCGANIDNPDSTTKEDKKNEKCWNFKHSLPFMSRQWRKRASRYASRILRRTSLMDNDKCVHDPHMMHVARLMLMLADHHYSSLTDPAMRVKGDSDQKLAANTIRSTGELNQPLDEHLIGVETVSSRIANELTQIDRRLPRLARHRGFKSRSKDPRFRWQDTAYDLANSIRSRAAEGGFFGVNMASTGCGKTLANGRIMYALSEPEIGCRFSVALGLRVLTLQTGDVFRKKYSLGPDDLAVLVGGSASRELYEHYRNIDNKGSKHNGSESSDSLLPDDSFVHYEGSVEDGPLRRWLSSTRGAASLINAPILVCTIDHLIMATESARGGHQIAPMLRLMTSDLVLDEPDDFGMEDLPALARLVNWAGLLGSRVLLSSATLPPSVIGGLFTAYLNGREVYQRNRGAKDRPLNICAAWFDEFGAEAGDQATPEEFMFQHEKWTQRRIEHLEKKGERRRKAFITPMQYTHKNIEELREFFANKYLQQAEKLHGIHHAIDPDTKKRISFGLIRMANIKPLVGIIRTLLGLDAPIGHRLHICCYHSNHPLLVRSTIERRLDDILDRHDPQRIFNNRMIRSILDSSDETDHIFIVMATAVAEVGRDHDYDWAIVEPSSMRSIIQLAGRVRRHRKGECNSPNLCLLDENYRSMKSGGRGLAFIRPGFESDQFSLNSHKLTDILTQDQLAAIDSRPRIQRRPDHLWSPKCNLVDLEHDRLNSLLLTDQGANQRVMPVSHWWDTNAHLSGLLQKAQPFRKGQIGDSYVFQYDDNSEEVTFCRVEDDGGATELESMLYRYDLKRGKGMVVWNNENIKELTSNLARELGITGNECSLRFGRIELPRDEQNQGWDYHPALGLNAHE